MLLWGGWLIVTGLVFSFAKGIIHPYYTVALAPAIGALVGIGASALWETAIHLRRASRVGRRAGGAPRCGPTSCSTALPSWMPWLGPVVLVIGLGSALVLVVAPRVRGRAALALGAAGVCAALAGPAAYALDTAATAHSGAIPSAGPSTGTGPGGFPGRPGANVGGFPGAGRGGLPTAGGAPASGATGAGGSTPPSGFGGAGRGSLAPGGFAPPSGGRGALGAGGGRAGRPRGGGGAGGFLSISTPGTKLVKALEADAGTYTWVAAAVNSNAAAGYQLATDDPVMAIGGFNGTDPAPTLAQFERYVAEKKIHYFISGGSGPGNGSSGTTASQITQWVESHFTAETLDGVTVYNLSGR